MLPVSRFRRLCKTYYKLPVSMLTCVKRQPVVIYNTIKMNELFSPQISYNSARRHLILYKVGSTKFPMNINRAFEI